MSIIFEDDGQLQYIISREEDIEMLASLLDKNVDTSGKNLEIRLEIKNYDQDIIDKLDTVSKKLPDNLSTLFVVRNKGSVLNCSDLELFINLEESLSKEKKGLFFDGGLEWYDLGEVINAQEQIENFTKNIREMDASPFEKYLVIYNFLTSKVYKEDPHGGAKSRDIIGVLNGDNIVCVGYAQMLKRLCNEVGIECYTQGCGVRDKQDGSFLGDHENNLVRMRDEKYGIDGLFYADACWDAVVRGEEHKRTYSYCLLPLKDKDKLKYATIDVSLGQQFFYDSEKESILCGKDLRVLEKYGIHIESKKQKTQWNFFGLDNKAGLDKNELNLAGNRLRQVFEENNIPADVYSSVEKVPEICSFSRMFALCMEENVDKKRMDESLETLRKFVKLKDNFDYREDRVGFCDENIEDVYKTIDELMGVDAKSKDPKVGGGILSWVVNGDGYKLSMTDFKQGPHFTRPEKKPRKETIPERIKTAKETIMNERKVKEQVTAYIGKSEAVPIDAFAYALKRSYELDGTRPAEIDYKTRKALEDTIERTEQKFDMSAENCFTQQALKNRALENEGLYV